MRENVEHDAHDNSGGPGTAGTANVWLKNHCETENRSGLCAKGSKHTASLATALAPTK